MDGEPLRSGFQPRLNTYYSFTSSLNLLPTLSSRDAGYLRFIRLSRFAQPWLPLRSVPATSRAGEYLPLLAAAASVKVAIKADELTSKHLGWGVDYPFFSTLFSTMCAISCLLYSSQTFRKPPIRRESLVRSPLAPIAHYRRSCSQTRGTKSPYPLKIGIMEFSVAKPRKSLRAQ